VIKAQKYRTQEKNRQDALERLIEIIKQGIKIQKNEDQPSRVNPRKQNEWIAKPSRGKSRT